MNLESLRGSYDLYPFPPLGSAGSSRYTCNSRAEGSATFGCVRSAFQGKTGSRRIQRRAPDCHRIEECLVVQGVLGLEKTPPFTTLQKSSLRLLRNARVTALIESSIFLVFRKRLEILLASVDPCQDIAQRSASFNALPQLKIECPVADAGYDSEGSHEKIRTRGLIPP